MKLQNRLSVSPYPPRSLPAEGTGVTPAAAAGVPVDAPSQGSAPVGRNPNADRVRDFFVYEAQLQAVLGLANDLSLLNLFAPDLGYSVSDSGAESYSGPFPALPTTGIDGLFGSTLHS